MNDNAIDVKSRNGKNPPRERIKNAGWVSPHERDALDVSQPRRAQNVRISSPRFETNIPVWKMQAILIVKNLRFPPFFSIF